MVNYLPVMQETQVRSVGWEDPLEKGMATHSSILPGESRGQRSPVGYSPWGCKSWTRLSDWHFHCHPFIEFVIIFLLFYVLVFWLQRHVES